MNSLFIHLDKQTLKTGFTGYTWTNLTKFNSSGSGRDIFVFMSET